MRSWDSAVPAGGRPAGRTREPWRRPAGRETEAVSSARKFPRGRREHPASQPRAPRKSKSDPASSSPGDRAIDDRSRGAFGCVLRSRWRAAPGRVLGPTPPLPLADGTPRSSRHGPRRRRLTARVPPPPPGSPAAANFARPARSFPGKLASAPCAAGRTRAAAPREGERARRLRQGRGVPAARHPAPAPPPSPRRPAARGPRRPARRRRESLPADARTPARQGQRPATPPRAGRLGAQPRGSGHVPVGGGGGRAGEQPWPRGPSGAPAARGLGLGVGGRGESGRLRRGPAAGASNTLSLNFAGPAAAPPRGRGHTRGSTCQRRADRRRWRSGRASASPAALIGAELRGYLFISPAPPRAPPAPRAPRTARPRASLRGSSCCARGGAARRRLRWVRAGGARGGAGGAAGAAGGAAGPRGRGAGARGGETGEGAGRGRPEHRAARRSRGSGEPARRPPAPASARPAPRPPGPQGPLPRPGSARPRGPRPAALCSPRGLS